MSFKFVRNLKGCGAPVLERVIIDNSDVISIGEMVKAYLAGNAEAAVADRPLLGVVHDIQTKDGRAPTWDAGTTDTVTVASDNETVGLIACLVDCDRDSIYSATVTGTIGTTNTSSKIGVSIDITDSQSVAETTAVRNAQGQMYGWGTDPNSSTRMLVSIMESERFPGGSYS